MDHVADHDAGSVHDPILLGGVAGSGKTEVGSMLGRHPEVERTRKLYLWRSIYGRFGKLAEPANLSACIEAVCSLPTFEIAGVTHQALAHELRGAEATYGAVFDAALRINGARKGAQRWCDQLGFAEAHADQAFAEVPGLRMIHMIRDPRSSLGRQRAGRLGWVLGRWISSTDLARRNARLHGERYLVVRYEDLVASPGEVSSAIWAFLGLDAVAEAEVDPHPESATTSRSARFIEEWAGSSLVDLGYGVTPPGSPTARYRLLERPANRIGLDAWRHMRAPDTRSPEPATP